MGGGGGGGAKSGFYVRVWEAIFYEDSYTAITVLSVEATRT
jgi:hypothetical protein